MKTYRAMVMPGDSGGDLPAKATSPPAAPAGDRPASVNSAGSAVAPSSSRPETAPVVGGAASASGPASANVAKSRSPRKVIRFLRPDERLPKGLPDWFKARDTNGDGQVSMAEFSTDWNPAKEAEFLRLDVNHDGMITPHECLKVEKKSGSH
jgi:hypothetical protein